MNKKQVKTIALILLFTVIISFTWNYYLMVSHNKEMVLNKSRAFFEQILVTRSWNASHGGIYVPVTEQTLPNPYLEDSLRDIVTTGGMRLTKINPAYMTRQISEINNVHNDLQFHITSIKPLRPDNSADEWEKQALELFETGTLEKMEMVNNGDHKVYRYMAPLETEQSCLQCHAKQNYQFGDIRGGISVSFPATLYIARVKNQTFWLVFIHFFILAGGAFGLLFYYRMSVKYLSEIQQSNSELLQLNATKDKFFNIIAHDLKSPFNSIMGFSELLTDQIKEKDYEGIDEYAGIIEQSSKRAMDLLENLLEWSRSQTGRLEYNPEFFELGDFIEAATPVFDDVARQKSITIKRSLPRTIHVYADKHMISAVMRNLISNAIKFTRQDGEIKISAEKRANEIFVSVSDNGVGISTRRIDNLFRLDKSESTTGTAKEQGTGLGLILCKEFVEKHGGKIWVESEEGIGTTFYFTLPYHGDPVKETVVQQLATSDKTDQIRKLKILIAEDDEVSEMLIDSYVKSFAREILKAKTGGEAVEVCRTNPDIDLIWMDIRLPEMGGYEATRQIREFNSEVVIIAQTAYGLTGDKHKSIASGCNDYIAKPIDETELHALIQKYFR
jgi:signal transduction histidine kinase/CheY-like chemotaxis protein